MNFLEIIFILLFKRTWYDKKILVVFGEFIWTLFLNIIVNDNFFSDLKFEYYCEYYPEILLQLSLKQETKIDGKDHEIFSEKITGPWNI